MYLCRSRQIIFLLLTFLVIFIVIRIRVPDKLSASLEAAGSRVSAGDRRHSIFYYHFSKNAGRQMCLLARRNNERLMSNGTNNDCDGGKPKIMPLKSCEAQEAAARETDVTFFSDEINFNLRLNCSFSVASRIITMTAIRHPASRTASAYMFLHKQGSMLTLGKVDTNNPKPASFYFEEQRQALAVPRHVFFLENWQTRRILRHHLSGTASTAVNATLATELLSAVDIVFPLERICDASVVFNRILGWSIEESRKALLMREHSSVNTSMLAFEVEAWPRIQQQHWADMMLWNLANERLDYLLKALGVHSTDCPKSTYTYIPYHRVPEIIFLSK